MFSSECKERGEKIPVKATECPLCGKAVHRLSLGTWLIIIIVVPMFIYGYFS